MFEFGIIIRVNLKQHISDFPPLSDYFLLINKMQNLYGHV